MCNSFAFLCHERSLRSHWWRIMACLLPRFRAVNATKFAVALYLMERIASWEVARYLYLRVHSGPQVIKLGLLSTSDSKFTVSTPKSHSSTFLSVASPYLYYHSKSRSTYVVVQTLPCLGHSLCQVLFMISVTWFISEWLISPSGSLFPTILPINFNTRFFNYLLWKFKPKKRESF